MADRPDLDDVIVPIGGGGILSGTATAMRALGSEARFFGVEAALYPSMYQAIHNEAALYPSMYQAIHNEVPSLGGQTLADGIAVKKPGVLTKAIVQELVEDIFIVDESAVETGVLLLIELQKVLAEGAGAAPVAALLDEDTRAKFAGRKVGLVITGGNIDVRLLSWVLTRGLVRDGRIVRLRIDIIDRPGVLAQVAKLIGDSGGNIIEVYHQRLFYDVPAKEAEVDAVVETRNEKHVDEIVANLRGGGFATRVLSARAADPTTI
jgi:threonine dehydratase